MEAPARRRPAGQEHRSVGAHNSEGPTRAERGVGPRASGRARTRRAVPARGRRPATGSPSTSSETSLRRTGSRSRRSSALGSLDHTFRTPRRRWRGQQLAYGSPRACGEPTTRQGVRGRGSQLRGAGVWQNTLKQVDPTARWRIQESGFGRGGRASRNVAYVGCVSHGGGREDLQALLGGAFVRSESGRRRTGDRLLGRSGARAGVPARRPRRREGGRGRVRRWSKAHGVQPREGL